MPWKHNETRMTKDGYETHWFPDEAQTEYGERRDKDGNFITNKRVGLLAETLAGLYVSYRKRYGMSRPGQSMYVAKKDGKDERLTNKRLTGHLFRNYSIHVFAGWKSSRFICFDVDVDDWKLVTALMKAMEEYGISHDRIYPSTSGNKGYHVDVFFEDVVYTSDLKEFFDWCMRRLKDWKQDTGKIEFRPTHGHSIKLPLSVHGKTGNICWYVDRDTGVVIDSVDYILDIQQVPVQDFLDMKEQHPLPQDPDPDKADDEGPARGRIEDHVFYPREFTELPKWAPDLTEPASRHNTMLKIAIGCKRRSIDQTSTEKLLTMWLEAQPEEYYDTSFDGCIRDAEAICDWVYSDRCEVEYFRRPPTQEEKDERREKGVAWMPAIPWDKVTENGSMDWRKQMDDPMYAIDAMTAMRVLSIKGDAARRLYFLVMAEQVAVNDHGYGSYHASMEWIGKIIGFSTNSVHTSVQKMIGADQIWWKLPKTKLSADGTFLLSYGFYRVKPVPVKEKYEGWERYATGRGWTGRIYDLEKNFLAHYLGALMTVLDPEYVLGRLTKRERDALNALAQDGDAFAA